MFALPLAALISARAASPRCLSRHPRRTVAPDFAKPRAVALPSPELLPVTRQIFLLVSACVISSHPLSKVLFSHLLSLPKSRSPETLVDIRPEHFHYV